MSDETLNAECLRLQEARKQIAPWKKWGPYLSERQWGTVREDYSQDGNAWDYFTHDQARSRAYHWGEDGLAGISDDKQLLCFSVALWNGKDPILKERLFGLTNSESNHGEDVKEYYFYLDSTPTHSYMKYLYKYPQAAFPYDDLVATSRQRNRGDMEYELLDTGIFNDDRYFDVFVEYAKDSPEDMLIQISVCNRGPEPATLHVLPTLWFRNTWTWWPGTAKPSLKKIAGKNGWSVGCSFTRATGRAVSLLRGRCPSCCSPRTKRTTSASLARPTPVPYVKDGINNYVVNGKQDAINPEHTGTKAAAHYQLDVEAWQDGHHPPAAQRPGPCCRSAIPSRTLMKSCRPASSEADEFYRSITPERASKDEALRHATGAGGNAVEQAVLWFRRGQVAGGT